MKIDVRDGMKLQTIADTDVQQEPQDEGRCSRWQEERLGGGGNLEQECPSGAER